MSKTPDDFKNTRAPVTAWAFYEVFERKHCGTGWLRAQMAKLEHENVKLRKAVSDAAKFQRKGMAEFIASKSRGAHMRYKECRHAAECLEAVLQETVGEPKD